jgi:hypothetical protein
VGAAAEVQHAAANAFQFFDCLERIVVLLQDAAGVIHHHLSCLRQREASSGAFVELGASLVLEAADLLEYRGGGKMHALARAAEGAQLGYGNERAKMRKFHERGGSQSIIALDSEIWNDQF